MGLIGEWWIDDMGMSTFADGDVGDINHEGMAFFYALGLDMDDPAVDVAPGDKFTSRQIAALREHGAPEDAIQALKGGGDAREYQMQAHNWIRVKNSSFQLNDFDDDALKRIQEFISSEYPEDEDPLVDEFEIEELKPDGQHLTLTGQDILESGKTAAAMKYSARRERPEWHNPGEPFDFSKSDKLIKEWRDQRRLTPEDRQQIMERAVATVIDIYRMYAERKTYDPYAREPRLSVVMIKDSMSMSNLPRRFTIRNETEKAQVLRQALEKARGLGLISASWGMGLGGREARNYEPVGWSQ